MTAGRANRDVSPAHINYDLNDPATADTIVAAKPDGIFHLAWSTTPSLSEADPAEDLRTNVAGSIALLQRLTGTFAGPVVFVSSGGTVYGSASLVPTPEHYPLLPLGSYGLGKATVEAYAALLASRGRDVRTVRMSNPFGTEQSIRTQQGVIPIFVRKICRGEPLTIWGDGHIVRDYIHVSDGVEALITTMQLSAFPAGETSVLNVGSGVGTSLLELIEMIGRLSSISPRVEFQAARKFDVPANVLDISKINRLTGWTPKYDLESGLRLLLAGQD